MLAALSEWFSGVLVLCTGDVSLFYDKWRELVDIFMTDLCGLSEKESKEWVAYIYNLNSTSHVSRTDQANAAIALPMPTL